LDYPKFRLEEEVEERVKRPGVVIGLAWTPVGGDILFVEANVSKGARHLIVTGQIGEVMQESTKAALTWVRSKERDLRLDTDFYKDTDIHVHVPARFHTKRWSIRRCNDGDRHGVRTDQHTHKTPPGDDR
jgi:ATP-dependent Lon protease